jgi:hypothetical protein
MTSTTTTTTTTKKTSTMTKKTSMKKMAGSGSTASTRVSGSAVSHDRSHTPQSVRLRVATQLLDGRDCTGRGLNLADVKRFAETTGRSTRQIRRWVKDEEDRRARALLTAGGAPDRSAKDAARRALTGRRPRFELTDEMLTVLAAAPNTYEAWLFLRYQDTESSVAKAHVSKSTFYEAVNRLPAAVRAGLVRGSEDMRNLSPHLPRQILRLGESYSYDLKNLRVACLHDGGEIHSDNWLLSFRDEATSLIVGRWVLPYVPTDAEVAALYAETVRGWSWDGITIAGAPQLLRTDNATNLNGPQMRRAQVLCGSLITASEVYESAGNGRHERMHLDLDREMRTLPGYTRAALKRGKQPYVVPARVELLTFDQLASHVYDLIDSLNFEHRPDTERHQGRTPFEMAADHLATGEHDLLEVSDDLLAPLGLPLPERTYNLNEGTLTWDTEPFHHPDLADRGDTRYRATRLPNDPSIVFVLDLDDHYVTTAVRLRELPTGLHSRTIRERKEREHLVDRHQQAAARRLGASSWTNAFVPAAEPNDSDDNKAAAAPAALAAAAHAAVAAEVVAEIPAAVAAAATDDVADLLAARGVTA